MLTIDQVEHDVPQPHWDPQQQTDPRCRRCGEVIDNWPTPDGAPRCDRVLWVRGFKVPA